MKYCEIEMDALGRIAIPKEIRETLNIAPKTALTLQLKDNAIVAIAHTSVCQICGELISPKKYFRHCDECIAAIKADKALAVKTIKTYIQRVVDERGMLVLPVEYRNALNMGKTGLVNVELNGETIVIEPATRVCAHCKSTVAVSKEYHLCNVCIENIKRDYVPKEVEVINE